MASREEWILGIVVATFLLLLALFALLVLRRLRKPEVEILLDAIDGVRAQVDLSDRNTVLEHEEQIKKLDKANGRLQFLLAKDIAEELGAQRDREAKEREAAVQREQEIKEAPK